MSVCCCFLSLFIKNIEGFDELICYGEYFGDCDKDEISIIGKIIVNNGNWEILYTFPSKTIGHIHSIIPDNIRNVVWIFTGDFKNSIGIWMAKNNFKNVNSIFRGNQKYRACVGFSIKEGLLYATDSPFEKNYIKMLTQNQLILLEIAKKKGYVTYVDARHLYSTIQFLENALKRLVELGYLKISSKPNVYEYIK